LKMIRQNALIASGIRASKDGLCSVIWSSSECRSGKRSLT
jgi:hypothetical protein